ncbi:efflux RND transporter periplasmic adaptor subunit [Arcticibacter sp. MXS-1]|uniref:efflux RND transporter periplasmic adaptor subunit n=1 Tax=Arcticibacter sp. MXS-1 TaxID=3341726 RepID=UPI0035A93057
MKREIIALLAAGTFLMSACKEKAAETKTKNEVCISDSLTRLIRIDTVKTANIKDELSLSGEVSFDDNKVVKVFPFASGQVLEVKVSLGDHVSRGQTLAVIRSADVAGTYTDLSATQSDLSIARRQLEQAQYLYKSGISSERDYTEAKENYNKALSANRKIREQIAINGRGSTGANGMYVIKAPEGGFIVEKNISAGSFIRQDNGASLFTISDMKDVWVWANVFESDISKVKQGYTAKVTTLAYPGKVFEGRVDEVSSVLDPDNKVMKVKIVLPNPGMQLKPEMFTNVLVTNNEPSSSVAVPSDAVIFDSSKNYVIVYKDRCHLQIREVNVIKSVENVSYIGSGLKPGELVISKNQLLLYNALSE